MVGYVTEAQKITTNFKSFSVSDDGQTVTIEGSWHRVAGKVGSQVPTVNSVIVECYKRQRICREYVARLIDPNDDPMAPSRMLMLSTNEFEIKSWMAGKIVAKSEPRIADWYIRINLALETAERESQETEARGAKGARTTPDKWILR
jgi:hypothetical protein